MKTVLECIREAYMPRRRPNFKKDKKVRANINVFACGGGSGCGGGYSYRHSYCGGGSGCGGGC